jgi:hypothetical protein
MPLHRWISLFVSLCALCGAGVSFAAAEDGPVVGSPQDEARFDEASAALLAMHTWVKNEDALDLKTSYAISDPVLGLSSKGTVHFRIQRPNSFRVDVVSGGKRDVFISDGERFTIYRPQKNTYAQLAAQDTILGTMFKAIGGLTLQARLIEFFWTVDYLSVGAEDIKVTAGGSSQIRGTTCRKYEVVRATEAWDVWIAQGEVPFACRLISRTTDQSASTVQSNELIWTLKPSFSADTFVFKPPANAKEVSLSGLQ